MPRQKKTDTLRGKGYLLEGNARHGDAYYVIEEYQDFAQARGESIPGQKMYRGIVELDSPKPLALGSEYTLVLEDGRRLRFLVKSRDTELPEGWRYTVWGQGGIHSA